MIPVLEGKMLTLSIRPVTPNINGPTPESGTPAPSVVPGVTDSFEASIVDVEIDLGDF